MTDSRPTVILESVRPPEMPILAALVDALLEAGFDPVHRRPVEQRSAASVLSFVAVHLGDALAAALIAQLVGVVRAWAAVRLRPLMRERGIQKATVPIYGASGEILYEVVVDDTD